jgi:FkbM family methyltransferase
MRLLRKYSYYLFSIFELFVGFKNPALILGIFLGRIGSKSRIVHLRSGPAFRVRGAMDVWSIKETFLDRFYERCGFVIQSGWTVIDIGAGLGDFTLFAALVDDTRVVTFEPFPESFVLLKENATLNKAKNIEAFSEAVSSTEGTLLLDLAGGEPLQFQSRNAPVTQPDSQITVRARSLSDVVLQTGQGTCDLLKLDCEGAEYDILMKSPPEILAIIQRIVLEYHDGITAYSHHDLVHFLHGQGFKVQTFDNLVHENLGYLRAER